MEITQILYEKYKIVSYPRTDSCCLSMELYNEIGRHIDSCNFGKFQPAVGKIDIDGFNADKSYFNDAKVTDHHAIIPTINDNAVSEYQNMTEEERHVYDAIVYRFLAIFYPPYEYAATTLITEIKGFRFKSSGINIKNLGYKELIHIEEDERKADEEEQQLPMLKKGDMLETEEINLLSKKTTPPPRYTIDSIITLMQKHQIGTSATMAEIIKKLQNPKRQSIILEKGSYQSTPFGRKYISVVPEMLKSPDLTRNIEEKLDLIVTGKYTKEEFLKEIMQQITDYIHSVKDDNKIMLEREAIGICPVCNSPVREQKFNYTCGTGGCFNIGKSICGKNITNKMAENLLKTGKTSVIKGFRSKAGKSFDARLIYDYKNGKIEFEFQNQQRMKK